MNRFGLISQVLRGYWMMLPEEVIANSILVSTLLSHGQPASVGSILSDQKPMAESVNDSGSSYSEAEENSVAIISMSGTMVKYGTMCSYGTEEVAEMITRAADSENISAIVFVIDSPGGSIDAIPPLSDAIGYSRKKGKPVVALCDGCASAAYWVATCCDRIVAGNDLSARFGSIGVMCSFADAQPFYEKQGYKFHEIYSDHSQDKNKVFNLALEGKYDLIKEEQLNPLALRFQETVKTNRPSLDISIPGILSGKMFWAADALKHGMIDEIGSLERAVELAREVLDEYTIHSYLNS